MSSIPDWFLGFFNSSGNAVGQSSAPADVGVDLKVSDRTAKVGETVKFTITASNAGPGAASGLGIAIPLGAAFAFASASPSVGTYDPASGIWAINSIDPSKSVTLTLTVQVRSPGWNQVSAQVVAQTSVDTNATNDIAYAVVSVPPASTRGPVVVTESRDGTDTPEAVVGSFNQQVITGQALGAVVLLHDGYQSAVLTGSNAAQLVDLKTGNALLVASANQSTIIAAAGHDTLQGGDGDNMLVGFADDTTMNAQHSSGKNLFYGVGTATINGGSGNDTTVLLKGGTVNTGTGGSQVWFEGGTGTIQSNGADTIIAAAGTETINVTSATGTGGALIFGGTGNVLINGGAGVMTVVGLSSSVTLNGGSGGGVFFGGGGGNNVMNSGTGQVSMFGGGNNDLLVATGSANDVLVASAGAETLDGSASSGSLAFFGGLGPDVMIGGTGVNAFSAGIGDMTLVGGGTTDLYAFVHGTVNNTVIENFNATNDYVNLQGFGVRAADQALLTMKDTSAGAVVNLDDGTQITFANVAKAAIDPKHFF